jgi:hypothetical protein
MTVLFQNLLNKFIKNLSKCCLIELLKALTVFVCIVYPVLLNKLKKYKKLLPKTGIIANILNVGDESENSRLQPSKLAKQLGS